jgi:TRAP-type uncharacterized transport system substrate-binding protein
MDSSEKGLQRFKDFMPEAALVSLDANPNIPGLMDPVTIIKIPWVMVTHKDAPEDLVYRMTKTIAENKDKLSETFGAFKRASLKEMAPASQVPYHPGALKYYQEAQIVVGN